MPLLIRLFSVLLHTSALRPRRRGGRTLRLREDVVVAGGGVVVGDHGRQVEGKRPIVVDSTPREKTRRPACLQEKC